MQNIEKGALALLLGCLSLPLVGQIPASGAPPASAPRPAFGPHLVPAPPPTLEQLPASAPRVAFQGGQLTIVARNASLGAILREVESQTGATVDMPANPTDRVVGQFGPGPAREVLASLLNGSRFNYVLMGSPQDPTSLDKIVLLRKPPDQPGGASQGANTAQMIAPRQGAIVTPSQDDDTQDNTEETMEADPPAEDQANQVDGQQGGGQPAVKTPQQLLQELQQQQQLQQQQGQQGGPLGAPPPQQIQNRLQQ